MNEGSPGATPGGGKALFFKSMPRLIYKPGQAPRIELMVRYQCVLTWEELFLDKYSIFPRNPAPLSFVLGPVLVTLWHALDVTRETG